MTSAKGIPWPKKVSLVVFDFDGVMTDNGVYVFPDGNEAVRCSRADGLGIEKLRKHGVPMMILSKEPHPVVMARAKKLQIPCMHGVDDKKTILSSHCHDNSIDLANVVYVGNDVNDLECMEMVGLSIAVADAEPDVIAVADHVLSKKGGKGAVREFCDLLLSHLSA